jgi:hypothetical protein
MEDFGTYPYTVFAYCPTLSAVYGNVSFGTSTKLGGLVAVSCHAPTAGLLNFASFSTPNVAYSMSDIYGS